MSIATRALTLYEWRQSCQRVEKISPLTKLY